MTHNLVHHSLIIDQLRGINHTAFPLTGAANDGIIDGPKNIVYEWAALKAAGFKTVDTVFPDPLNNNQAFFLSGNHYVLINVQQGEFIYFALSQNLIELMTSLCRTSQGSCCRQSKTNMALLKGSRL